MPGAFWINKCFFLTLLILIWVHGLRETTHLLWKRVCHKIFPQALLALNYPKRFLGAAEERPTHWLAVIQNGWWSTLVVLSWPVFNSFLFFITASCQFSVSPCSSFELSAEAWIKRFVWQKPLPVEMGLLSSICLLFPRLPESHLLDVYWKHIGGYMMHMPINTAFW